MGSQNLSKSESESESESCFVYSLAARSLVLNSQGNLPKLSFNLESVLPNSGFEKVDPVMINQIYSQVIEAYEWCSGKLPLCHVNQNNQCQPFIVSINIGKSANPSELLTASSIQNRGNMILAADWILPSIYRLGSLIAHEAVHQILFLRELQGSVIRENSIGYSPWKGTLRKGRLIWHSFWSFTCQFSFLAESVLKAEKIVCDDQGVLSYLAEIYAKIFICQFELAERTILIASESSACDIAFKVITEIKNEVVNKYKAATVYEEALSQEHSRYQTWAIFMIRNAEDVLPSTNELGSKPDSQ